ncbi:MAG TPA: hypothetical protein V6C78_22350 [Crinalium sp.]|jgi:hypothetical protein
MKALKSMAKVAKLFALVLSILLFVSSTPALAYVIPAAPTFAVDIAQGKFDVNVRVPNPLSKRFVVRSAVVSLPPGETGTIDSIVITGPTAADPNGGRLFGCSNIKVQNGIDLIKACGGPAELLTGGTLVYQASGSNFSPNEDIKLGIALSDEFSS